MRARWLALLAWLLLLPSVAGAQLQTIRAKQIIVTDGQNSVLQAPTMTTAQRNASTHVNGQIINCSDCSPAGGYMYMGGSWISLAGGGGLGNVTTGALAVNTIPKATGATVIANSALTDTGTTLTYGAIGTDNRSIVLPAVTSGRSSFSLSVSDQGAGNDVFNLGYNVAPGGGKVDAAEPKFHYQTEALFSARQRAARAEIDASVAREREARRAVEIYATTVRELARPGTYARLEGTSRTIADGLRSLAGEIGVELTTCSIGGMFGLFFHPGPVRSYTDARKAHAARFRRFFHAMLDDGIYLAPSPFEAGFVSLAHRAADVDRTLEAARGALRRAARVR